MSKRPPTISRDYGNPFPSRGSVTTSRIKSVGKMLARRLLKVSVHRVPSRKYDLYPFLYANTLRSSFLHFYNLLTEVKELNGVIVECGVGVGQSLFHFSAIGNSIGVPRHIYGFDTFEGIPDPTSEDGEWNSGIGGDWNYSQKRVTENLLLAGLDAEFISTNITLVPGNFAQTLSDYAGRDPIVLLHIDADIYESYKTVLESLYDYVVPSGIIAFDEYLGSRWPGAVKAIDEFFEHKPEKIVKSPVIERYYTVKH